MKQSIAYMYMGPKLWNKIPHRLCTHKNNTIIFATFSKRIKFEIISKYHLLLKVIIILKYKFVISEHMGQGVIIENIILVKRYYFFQSIYMYLIYLLFFLFIYLLNLFIYIYIYIFHKISSLNGRTYSL